VKYVRRNFVCGLQGREPASLPDFNAELRRWVAEVADQRVHGTTHEQVLLRWQQDRENLQPINGRQPYPHCDDEQRRVARDAYVSWRGSRYSVPWQYAGKDVWVCEPNSSVEVRYGSERIALVGRRESGPVGGCRCLDGSGKFVRLVSRRQDYCL
jgi:hypothetical protein